MTRILVIPGIGDIHWVALKLRSFCQVYGITDPEVWVWNFDGRPRSLDYVRRLPFVSTGEYWNQGFTEDLRRQFTDCYMTGTADVVRGFSGFDFFICPNGSLRQGKQLATEILPECTTEWDYPLEATDGELAYGDAQLARGKYVLLYFSDQGMFRTWLQAWPVARVAQFIDHVHRLLPSYRLLLTGSSWDAMFARNLLPLVSAPIANLVGMTTLEQLLGLIRYASAFAGWCGGNTIIATHLKTPTYMLWSDYFCAAMQTNWVDPAKIGSIYHCDTVRAVGAIAAANRVSRIVQENPCQHP